MANTIINHVLWVEETLAEKDCFLQSIIQEAFGRGFRFLAYNDSLGWYEEITDYRVLRKHVSQALRDYCKRLRARKRLQNIDCNTNKFTDPARNIQTWCHARR